MDGFLAAWCNWTDWRYSKDCDPRPTKHNGTSKREARQQQWRRDTPLAFVYVIHRPIRVRIPVDNGVLFTFEHRRGWTRLKERCRRCYRIDVGTHRDDIIVVACLARWIILLGLDRRWSSGVLNRMSRARTFRVRMRCLRRIVVTNANDRNVDQKSQTEKHDGNDQYGQPCER